MDTNQLIQTLIWAAVILGGLLILMIMLRLVLSRRGRQGDRLGVAERLPLARDAELMLVRCDGREHLICITADGGFLVEADVTGATRAGTAAPQPAVAPAPLPASPPAAGAAPAPTAPPPVQRAASAPHPAASAPQATASAAAVRPASPPPPRPKKTAHLQPSAAEGQQKKSYAPSEK